MTAWLSNCDVLFTACSSIVICSYMLVDLIFFSLSEWHLEVIKKTKIQVSQSTSSALFSIFLLLKRGQIDPTPLTPNVFPTFKKGFEAIKMKLIDTSLTSNVNWMMSSPIRYAKLIIKSEVWIKKPYLWVKICSNYFFSNLFLITSNLRL